VSHLGSARTHTRVAISLQLEDLSAIAGITWWNFYFRLFPGAIKGPQIIEFLNTCNVTAGKAAGIWDGLPGHRSQLRKGFRSADKREMELERLPSYAPELNRSSISGGI